MNILKINPGNTLKNSNRKTFSHYQKIVTGCKSKDLLPKDKIKKEKKENTFEI